MKQCIQLSINKNLVVYIVFFCLLSNNLAFAQNAPGSEKKFVIGTFIASSGSPENQKYTQHHNYYQLLELGVNAVYQVAVKRFPALNQEDNYDSLSLFDFIWAANDSGTGSTDEININAEPENIDWISYFTSAKYMKWEAEGDPLFNGTVKIDHDVGVGTSSFAQQYTEGGITGIRSGIQQEDSGKYLIKGPNYWQYPRYTFTNPSWNPTPIDYIASFNMRLGSAPPTNVPVCSLFVVMTKANGTDTTLAARLVQSNEFINTNYKSISLPYDYSKYIYSTSPNQEHYAMPGSFGIKSPPGYNLGSTTEFKVQWLGYIEIFVDYIETYDQMIWNQYFKQFPSRVIDSIVTYDHEFTENSNFYSKLKYYYTMDEPHSLDGYEPLRKVQEILDNPNNNIQADLLTHWYPEWDGYRDGVPSFPVYKALAQPKKIMFWYAPFTNNKDTFVPDNRDFTLYFLHKHLQQAYTLDSLYFLSAQTFGRKTGTNYERWMLPDTSEVLAETMSALAHGCKGIFFENYYSYSYNEGLVKIPDVNHYYEPRPIWHTVKKIAARLNGVLGKTLVSLNYNATVSDSGFLRLYPNASIPQMEENKTYATVTKDYLTLSVYNNQPSPQIVNFHAGFYSHTSQDGNNYFLLTNQSTTLQRIVNVSVSNNQFTNIRFRNIEPEYNFDITFTNQTTQTLTFPAGEGYLFQVAPVALYGGKLVYNETVGDGMTLRDDMTIESGVTLTINGTYTANANITIKSGGIIKYGNSNSKIVFGNGNQLIIEGNAQVCGLSNTNKLTLDFNLSSSVGVIVKPGAVLTMYFCDVTNAVVGVKAEIGSSVNIAYSSFTNNTIPSTGKGILLFGFNTDVSSTLPTPIIKNCILTGFSIAITALNFPEVVIKENSINQSHTGIFIYGASSAYISSNSIIGSQTINNNYGDGILMLNCGGYLRNNTIKYFQCGVEFANSSPDLGVNTIEQNYKCGLYINSGSYPNLVQQLANPNCWYPIGGCNTIKNNGIYNGTIPIDPLSVPDGAEIFLNNGDVLLSGGGNEISDDRTGIQDYLTLSLIKGVRGNGENSNPL